jgi:hypothetical protein
MPILPMQRAAMAKLAGAAVDAGIDNEFPAGKPGK